MRKLKKCKHKNTIPSKINTDYDLCLDCCVSFHRETKEALVGAQKLK